MHARQLSILLLAGVALLAACGKDEASTASTTTTATSSARGVTTSTSGVTTTTEPKRTFSDGVGDIKEKLTAAKGDQCKLYLLSDDLNSVENPTTSAEDKQAVAILVEYFGDIADVLQAQHPSDATALRATATKFAQQAAASGYKLNDSSLNALNDTSFQQAFTTFEQSAISCASTSTVPPTG